nr:molybdopterin-dependent oxidoreductase [Eggerthella hominis]
MTRRSFVKWGTATAGAAALVGFTGCAPGGQQESSDTSAAAEGKGEWKTGACMNNCNCCSSRCLLKVYVEDGVPIKIRTDEKDEDTIEVPQRRACLRGRAQISNIMSPARIKYPMKRKGWSPEDPNGEMRGKDEWERISWEEALDYIAAELKKTYETYGPHSVFGAAYSNESATYFDPILRVMNSLGGIVHHETGTVSVGAWPAPELLMTGSMYSAPDALSIQESQLHLHFGNNWMANKAGNTALQLEAAREAGGKVIIIDPWLNQTAQAIADEWIPVRPGTDTALCLGMMYHQIENNLYDQDFLDTYCVGFDADHMPEGAPKEENFKDYVLGTHDGEPKTPEWAEAICGVPADVIRNLAEEVANTEKVNFFAGQSTTKIPAGEMFAQVFYTLAFMHGGLGTPGNFASWVGLHENIMSTTPYCMSGNSVNAFGKNVNNPLQPPSFCNSMPAWDEIEDARSWDRLEYSECWQSILDGEYGRDVWPGGKRPIDIHMIYSGGYENSLNSLPNANVAIKVFRKVDFVWGANPFFDPSRQYCDIVLPVATWWEKGNVAWTNNSETVYWADRIMDPLYEAKPETWISEELAKRVGLDPKTINTMTDAERTYHSLAGATYLTDHAAKTYEPLFTITQEDIDELGVEGIPQEGAMTVADFKERGLWKTQRKKGDALSCHPWDAYYADPIANPLATTSGKFEIHCQALADVINAMGFTTLAPIGKWQVADPEQGQGTQTDEYPLLLWTPHSLRRAHTVNDNVTSLREAFPQECFMSEVDADERGIKNGDLVLMTSPHGQVLRPAKVLPTLVPGSVALQDGAWIQIDEATGIDLGGDPNILQAPKASGQASQSWIGTLVQVEKYTGNLTLDPDKNRPIVMPVGVE